MKRKWPTKKYQIASVKGLTSRYDDAWDAREAARIATRRAREGHTVEVQAWSGGRGLSSAGRKMVHMTCKPASKATRAGKPAAACTLKPAFKKRVKGR